MPKQAENILRKDARRRYPGDKKRQDAFVYGTLRKIWGWKPAKKRKK